MLQGIFLTFIVEICCNKMILIVDMIRATCLQIQAKIEKSQTRKC